MRPSFSIPARVYLPRAFVFTGLLVSIFAGQWTVAFAVDITAIPVPKGVIYAGQVIDQRLLKDREVPTGYLNRVSVIVEWSDAVGKVARATLMPNRPISTGHVMMPNVVKVNKPTIMKYQIGTLRITSEVLPLNSAKAGEFVRVRNISSGVIVSGTAMKDGTIEVGALQ